MSFEKNKRPLLGEHKKSTTELLSSISSMAKNKSDFHIFYDIIVYVIIQKI